MHNPLSLGPMRSVVMKRLGSMEGFIRQTTGTLGNLQTRPQLLAAIIPSWSFLLPGAGSPRGSLVWWWFLTILRGNRVLVFDWPVPSKYNKNHGDGTSVGIHLERQNGCHQVMSGKTVFIFCGCHSNDCKLGGFQQCKCIVLQSISSAWHRSHWTKSRCQQAYIPFGGWWGVRSGWWGRNLLSCRFWLLEAPAFLGLLPVFPVT